MDKDEHWNYFRWGRNRSLAVPESQRQKIFLHSQNENMNYDHSYQKMIIIIRWFTNIVRLLLIIDEIVNHTENFISTTHVTNPFVCPKLKYLLTKRCVFYFHYFYQRKTLFITHITRGTYLYVQMSCWSIMYNRKCLWLFYCWMLFFSLSFLWYFSCALQR